jgi:lysophospholipid acyltransferase (LPLAT)-like uncharacterized protein
LVTWVAGLIGWAVIVSLGRTLRVEWRGPEGPERPRRIDGPDERKIFTFWHGELLTLAYTHRRRGICVLVSRHRDGEFIARILKKLGFETVRGSTSSGGRESAFQLCRNLRNGCDLAVTPDGPRGPTHRVQPGVVRLAQRTGASLVPLACALEKRLILDTWDRFQIPFPFSRVVIVSHAPIKIPRDLSGPELENHRAELEEALAEAGDRARDLALSAGIARNNGTQDGRDATEEVLIGVQSAVTSCGPDRAARRSFSGKVEYQ